MNNGVLDNNQGDDHGRNRHHCDPRPVYMTRIAKCRAMFEAVPEKEPPDHQPQQGWLELRPPFIPPPCSSAKRYVSGLSNSAKVCPPCYLSKSPPSYSPAKKYASDLTGHKLHTQHLQPKCTSPALPATNSASDLALTHPPPGRVKQKLPPPAHLPKFLLWPKPHQPKHPAFPPA